MHPHDMVAGMVLLQMTVLCNRQRTHGPHSSSTMME